MGRSLPLGTMTRIIEVYAEKLPHLREGEGEHVGQMVSKALQ